MSLLPIAFQVIRHDEHDEARGQHNDGDDCGRFEHKSQQLGKEKT